MIISIKAPRGFKVEKVTIIPSPKGFVHSEKICHLSVSMYNLNFQKIHFSVMSFSVKDALTLTALTFGSLILIVTRSPGWADKESAADSSASFVSCSIVLMCSPKKREGRILLRESSQGESSGLRVRLEGSLKTHYDAYSLPANAYSLPANAYSLC